MKTIDGLRKAALTIKVREMASSVRYLKSIKIDFDVYLPSRNMNLQRDFGVCKY